jgi:hypothetical protein
MSRQEKGSRMRMLPPKVQLQDRAALTGSYPTNVRFSIDGRTGDYPVNFNDTYSVVFTGSKNYIPGIGFAEDSIWLINSASNDLTGSIITTGSVRSQVIEGLPFFHFTPGQELTPFRDNDQPAVDGKSSNNSFFATGSAVTDVGEGFTSPLWSKNKIEIDISVAAACSGSLYIENYDGGANLEPLMASYGKSYEMLYYNFEQKLWQGVGKGIPYGHYHNGRDLNNNLNASVPYENQAMFAYAPSIINLVDDQMEVTGVYEWQASAGQPFTNLGYPYHPKYHATSSQVLKVNQYITEPFLVEKVVIELSAAYTIFAEAYNTASLNAGIVSITSITQSTLPASINNVFILNQRRNNKFSYFERIESNLYTPSNPYDDAMLQVNIPTRFTVSVGSEETYVDTVRDIITWGGITSFAANMVTSAYRSGQPFYASAPVNPQSENPKELLTRELVLTSNAEAHDDLTPLSWSGSICLNLETKSPIRIDRNANVNPADPPDNVFSLFEAGQSTYGHMDLKFSGGGRNALGINVPNGRNYVTPVAQIQTNGTFKNIYSYDKENILVKNEDRYRYNPYILLPTDELIIGWQQPLLNLMIPNPGGGGPFYYNCENDVVFSEIKFLPGPAKITLYGSYIRAGREYNDSLNQLLSSDGIHEVIGE